MGLFLEILKKTPWWVYLLFFFLVILSLRGAMQTRRVYPVQYLLFMPATIGILSLSWLSAQLDFYLFPLIYYFIGVVLGTGFGWVMVRHWVIDVDPCRRIVLPRSSNALILLILFFAIRYFFVYNYEVYPDFFFHLFTANALSSGLMNGIFIGRALQIYSKYKKKL